MEGFHPESRISTSGQPTNRSVSSPFMTHFSKNVTVPSPASRSMSIASPFTKRLPKSGTICNFELRRHVHRRSGKRNVRRFLDQKGASADDGPREDGYIVAPLKQQQFVDAKPVHGLRAASTNRTCQWATVHRDAGRLDLQSHNEYVRRTSGVHRTNGKATKKWRERIRCEQRDTVPLVGFVVYGRQYPREDPGAATLPWWQACTESLGNWDDFETTPNQ